MDQNTAHETKQDDPMKMVGTSDSFCGPTSTHYYPAAQQFPKSIYIFACVINVLGSVTTTLGNIMILFALRKCHSIHSPSKALLCSLALTDLVVGVAVLPLFTVYYLTIILEMPTYFCVIAVIYGRMASFVVAVSLATIAAIAIDRYLAFHLRLQYRQLVTLRRVVCVLVALWTGSWFWSAEINVLSGSILLFISCVIMSLCYFSIYRGLRRHFAQIRQQGNDSESGDFNVLRYKRTVNNMSWINVLFLGCFVPTFLSQLVITVMGLNNSTRFALHFAAVSVYFNSSLNPFLYCWRVKELRQNVLANLGALNHFLLSH